MPMKARPPHSQPAPPMISASITSALRWKSSTSSEAKPVVWASKAPAELEGKTEQDAVIAYLQGMGIQIKARR